MEIRGISNEWSEIIIRLNANGNWDISKNGEVVKNNVTAEALYEIFAWRGSSEVGVGLTLLVTDVQCITWTKENQNVKVFGEKVKDVITVDAATALDVVTNGIPGFEKVYAVKISSDGGKRLTSDVEVAKYEELRFAIRTVDGTLFMCMADAIDWNATTFGGQGGDVLYFALTQGDEGVWTVVMTNGDVSVEKTIFNVTTLQDFFWFNVHGYEIEVSELRGVEKAVEPWGVKVSDSAFGNTTVSSEKAPAGYQNVYEREVTVPGGRVDYSSPMGSVVITGYSELRFMVKSSKADVPFSMGSGSVDIYNWSFGTEWLEMKLVQNADGTWNVYRGETEFATNVSLANGNIQDVFAWLFAWDGASEGKVATIYSTELRGVEKVIEPWGVKVSDSAFGNTTVSLEKVPAGYQNVYEREYTVPGGRIDYGSALASADIRNYEKVVFAVKGTNANTTIILGSGAINIYDGGNGFTTEWVEFILTQNADGTWNVNMGEKVLATNVALTNGNIQEIFPWVYCWNSEGENQTTTFYVTELRGVEKVTEPWGVKVSDSAFGNTTVSSEKAPAGYQNVYEREVTVPGGRVDYSSPMGSVVITGYSELRFMVKSSKADVPFSMGSGSVDIYNWSFGTEWLEMKLVQNADGTWNVYRGETEFATNVSLANGNIQDVFAWLFAWDGASEGKVATIYSTELRGVEKVIEPWGVKVSDSAFGNTTVSLEKVPAGYQNVYEREYTVPGGRIDYGSALASADIRNYEKVVFAVKGTNANTTIILGSGAINIYDGGNGFTTEWVEFILTQNADGTWNVNMGEKVLATNVALTNGNIQEIFPWVYCWNSEGENQTTTFYVTELRGVEKVLE